MINSSSKILKSNETNATNYPDILTHFRNRQNERPMLFGLFTQMAEQCEELKSVKTLLSLGCGPGEYDLEFMNRCLPSLERCVFVERDASNNTPLEKRMKERYGEKVTYKMRNEDMCMFKPGEQFDLVAPIHSLSMISEEACTGVLQSCFEKWMKPVSGLLMVVIMDEVLDENGQAMSGLQKVNLHFKDRIVPMTEGGHVVREIERLGGELIFNKAASIYSDFTYAEDITAFFNNKSSIPIDSDTMKSAIEHLFPKGISLFPIRVILAHKK